RVLKVRTVTVEHRANAVANDLVLGAHLDGQVAEWTAEHNTTALVVGGPTEEARDPLQRLYIGRESGLEDVCASTLPALLDGCQREVAFGWKEVIEASLTDAG